MEDSIFLPIISIEAIALGLGAIALFVIGLQFKRGKWLRFIAGNTFATDGELKSPEQKKLGKRLGIVMHIGCAALAIQGCFLAFNTGEGDIICSILYIAACIAYISLFVSIAWMIWRTYLE